MAGRHPGMASFSALDGGAGPLAGNGHGATRPALASDVPAKRLVHAGRVRPDPAARAASVLKRAPSPAQRLPPHRNGFFLPSRVGLSPNPSDFEHLLRLKDSNLGP